MNSTSRCCVSFGIANTLRRTGFNNYFKHIRQVQELGNFPASQSLTEDFPTSSSFTTYCGHIRRCNMQNDGWKRHVISQSDCSVNKTEFFRCQLCVLHSLFQRDSVSCPIIPFTEERSADGEVLYGSPWCGTLYVSSVNNLPVGSVLLVSFYTDGTILSKSGTTGTTFVGVRFSNLRVSVKNGLKWVSSQARLLYIFASQMRVDVSSNFNSSKSACSERLRTL